MKILVYCPLQPTAPKAHTATLRSLIDLHWMEPLDIVIGREDMAKRPDHAAGYQNLTEKYRGARRMTLEGGYDALLTVEADMLLPNMTLERLSRLEADIAYGLYVSRRAAHFWLAFTSCEADFKARSFSKDPNLCREAWGAAVETKGIGMGCTLIRRHVLEQIDFRCPDTSVCNDWYFSLDAQAAGFHQVHDCGVVCGHIDGNKVYYPAEDGGYREEAWPT